MKNTSHTAIIGAGISGLSVAHALNKQHRSFHLFESGANMGGALQTTQKDGYLAEHGPNSILLKDKRVAALFDAVGLSETKMLASEIAKKRYIVHDGKPHAMPSSPLGMLRTPLFSPLGKLRFALEPFIGKYQGHTQGKGEESFASFVRRRLGPDMLASAAGPFVSGIYAGNPEKLSVRHAFPRLWNLEHHYGSFIIGALALQFGRGKNPHRFAPTEMLSFPDGMHTLPKAISQHLPASSMSCKTHIQSITRTDDALWCVQWLDATGETHTQHFQHLVLAVPHHKLPELPLPRALQQELLPISRIESPPVTSLVLGFRRKDVPHPLDGFGMLIKQSEKSPLLGVLFSSSMFEGRAPKDHVTLTCMMGGSIHPEYAENDDATVLAELHRLLGISADPTFRHRSAWEHAIPQYGLDYQTSLDAMESAEKNNPGLHLAGNYRGGISVGDCIVTALELGGELAAV